MNLSLVTPSFNKVQAKKYPVNIFSQQDISISEINYFTLGESTAAGSGDTVLVALCTCSNCSNSINML